MTLRRNKMVWCCRLVIVLMASLDPATSLSPVDFLSSDTGGLGVILFLDGTGSSLRSGFVDDDNDDDVGEDNRTV